MGILTLLFELQMLKKKMMWTPNVDFLHSMLNFSGSVYDGYVWYLIFDL